MANNKPVPSSPGRAIINDTDTTNNVPLATSRTKTPGSNKPSRPAKGTPTKGSSTPRRGGY